MAESARQVRIFVSSPGDARFERSRLERVIERLNGEFQGVALLKSIRWETEFYKAHDTFQAQIPESAQCDIVIAVFRSRLGTELPADFPRMKNGEAYPSGTAYEVLTAIEASKEHGLPDVYVFRYPQPPSVQLDDPKRSEVEMQWERLKAFFEAWFRTQEGHFKAAFQTFASTDDFERQADELLRKWLDDNVLHGRSVIWPIEVKGSPFCGLASFDAKHAPVFFGRRRDITKATERLKDAADKGCAFLLVDGASGAGKSSLVRAGLVPRLTAAGVVPSVDVWRVAVMRPGEISGDPFAALARALFARSEDLPDSERGRAPALPELIASDFPRQEDLSAQLAHADATSLKPLIGTLDAVARAERESGGYERDVTTAVLLVVDQLDELFSLTEEVRARFARLLDLFARSGRLWVIATLRAELFGRFLGEASLKRLREDGAAYDLAPPDVVELGEIVHGPANAAGLDYEKDPATGETLDERLLKDAAQSDLLPLLQFTLDQVFEQAKRSQQPKLLSFAAYRLLGGLEGAVNKQAESALQALGEAERARLPRLLRDLAAPARDGRVAGAGSGFELRAVPLAAATYDETAARLVRALIDAHILLSYGEGEGASLRLAHARILEAWQRAKDIVAENADFYRIRADVEEQRRKWVAANRTSDLLIGRGRPLAEAESIMRRFRDEVPAATCDFIIRSGRRARLTQTLTATAAVLFALIAATAVYLRQQAVRAQTRAEVALAITRSQADLRQGNVFAAIQNAREAYLELPEESSRSALLMALLEVSPNLVGTLELDNGTGQALSWLDNDTVAIALQSGRVDELPTNGQKRVGEKRHWELATNPASQDGTRNIRAFRLVGGSRLLVLLDDARIALLQPDGSSANVAMRSVGTVDATEHAVAVSNSGADIVVATIDGGVWLIKCNFTAALCDESQLTTLRARAVAISPDDSKIAVGDLSGILATYDLSGSPTGEPVSIGDSIISVSWATTGTLIAVGTAHGRIVLIDAKSMTRRRETSFGSIPISVLDWDPTGSDLGFVCGGNAICIWRKVSVATKDSSDAILRLTGHTNSITRLAWSPDGARLATLSTDGTMRVWSERQNDDVDSVWPPCNTGRMTIMATSPDVKFTAGGMDQGTICLWRAGSLVSIYKSPAPSEVRSLAWNKNSQFAAAYADGTIIVWSAAQADPIHITHLQQGELWDLTWTTDDRLIVGLLRNDGRVLLLDPADGTEAFVQSVAAPDATPWGICAHPDGVQLFVSYTDGIIREWNLVTRSLVATIAANSVANEKSGSRSLAVSPDGQWLAASGSASSVMVFNIPARALARILATQAKETRVVAFSPNGREMAALDAESRLYVWNTADAGWREVLQFDTIPGGPRAPSNLAESERAEWLSWLDNDRLVVAKSSGTVEEISLDERAWQRRIEGLRYQMSTQN